MVKAISILLAASGIPSVLGASWTVCVEGSASLLNTPIRAAILREFRSVMGGRDAHLEFGGCPAGSGSTRMLLSIKREAPEHLAGILGLARRRSDRIEPGLQVFHGSLVRYLGEPNNASTIGRALARVAAHEAAHFLDQQAHHCKNGLLRATFPAYELAAQNPWPFRHAPRCNAVGAEPRGPGLRADLRGRVPRALRAQRPDAEEDVSSIR